MSTVEKLRDVIKEYRKANKQLDDNLKKAEQTAYQNRQVQEEKQRQQS